MQDVDDRARDLEPSAVALRQDDDRDAVADKAADEGTLTAGVAGVPDERVAVPLHDVPAERICGCALFDARGHECPASVFVFTSFPAASAWSHLRRSSTVEAIPPSPFVAPCDRSATGRVWFIASGSKMFARRKSSKARADTGSTTIASSTTLWWVRKLAYGPVTLGSQS